MFRALERIPPLIARPSTPCTPAEIVAGPARWPSVLVLAPVTVFARLSASTIATITQTREETNEGEGGARTPLATTPLVTPLASPASAVSVLVHTPVDEVGEVSPLVSSVARPPKPAGHGRGCLSQR